MKNTLVDLQNHLFSRIEKLDDDELVGDVAKLEIEKSLALNKLAMTTIACSALIARCIEDIYGIPPDDDIPLLPKPKNEKFFIGDKRKSITSVPRNDDGYGYKKGKQRPI